MDFRYCPGLLGIMLRIMRRVVSYTCCLWAPLWLILRPFCNTIASLPPVLAVEVMESVCLSVCLSVWVSHKPFVRPRLCTTSWVQDYIAHHWPAFCTTGLCYGGQNRGLSCDVWTSCDTTAWFHAIIWRHKMTVFGQKDFKSARHRRCVNAQAFFFWIFKMMTLGQQKPRFWKDYIFQSPRTFFLHLNLWIPPFGMSNWKLQALCIGIKNLKMYSLFQKGAQIDFLRDKECLLKAGDQKNGIFRASQPYENTPD